MENDTNKTKGLKEVFIFGSWKRRNAKQKSKLTSTIDACVDNCEEAKNSMNLKTISTKENVMDSLNDYNMEAQAETEFVKRRAGSIYEHLHEEDFWCPRCNRKMEEPRLLPCLHSVCAGCVSEFMTEGFNVSKHNMDDSCSTFPNEHQSGSCPLCDYPLPSFGSPIPPPHYSLQHRLVIYAVRRRLSQRAICCDSCPEEVQATLHCSTCLCNYCTECGTEHEEEHTKDNFCSHRMRPLWEAKKVRRVAVCLSHPTHLLRFHCIACQQVTCKECMWQGQHRGHACEDAASAGKRAISHLSTALRLARNLLNTLLIEYNERVFRNDVISKSHIALNTERDRFSFEGIKKPYYFRNCSTISSHAKEARARIKEFSRLRRARHLIDAISLSEDLLANGSDVEILSLKGTIMKRLKFLGIPMDSQGRIDSTANNTISLTTHTGVFHCCSFCSSGGKKEAKCACSGTMPGGYKGCGHGHPGHAGLNHWSCCGSIYRDGYCLVPRKCTLKVVL